MRKPNPGEVVPVVMDRLGPHHKIGFLLVEEVELGSDYCDPTAEWILSGKLLRRYYFPPRDRFVIDELDEWSDNWLFSSDECLPTPIVPEYVDGVWFAEQSGEPSPTEQLASAL